MHQSICIFLNSKTASSYVNKYTSECLFVLPSLVIPKKSNISVSVQSASIPYSFFNCDDFMIILTILLIILLTILSSLKVIIMF